MDNLELRAPELLAEYEAAEPSRARDEIHRAGKQDVELYIRTYNTMLRSSGEVKIKALEQAHIDDRGLELRKLELKGINEPVMVRVMRA